MKKLLTFVFTMLVGASLAFAQAGTGTTAPASPDKTAPADSGKKATKSSKKGKKGGKKHKKSPTTTTTPAPK
jgi:hypothetical protein